VAFLSELLGVDASVAEPLPLIKERLITFMKENGSKWDLRWVLPRFGGRRVLSRLATETSRKSDVFVDLAGTRRIVIDLSKEYKEDVKRFRLSGNWVRILKDGTLFDYQIMSNEQYERMSSLDRSSRYRISEQHLEYPGVGYPYYSPKYLTGKYEGRLESETIEYYPQKDGYVGQDLKPLKTTTVIDMIPVLTAQVEEAEGQVVVRSERIRELEAQIEEMRERIARETEERLAEEESAAGHNPSIFDRIMDIIEWIIDLFRNQYNPPEDKRGETALELEKKVLEERKRVAEADTLALEEQLAQLEERIASMKPEGDRVSGIVDYSIAGERMVEDKQQTEVFITDRDNTAVAVTIDELMDVAHYEELRWNAKYANKFGVMDITLPGNRGARLYLAVDQDESKIEIFDSETEGKIYWLKDYKINADGTVNITGPVVGESITNHIDALGNRFVTIRDFAAKTERTDVYNAQGDLLKSTDIDREEIRYFDHDTGEEIYSTDYSKKTGLTLTVHHEDAPNTVIEHVTGVYSYTGTREHRIQTFINLRDQEQLGGYALVTRRTIEMGKIMEEKVGFIRIPENLKNQEQLFALVEDSENDSQQNAQAPIQSIFKMKESRQYSATGKQTTSKVEIRANGSGWVEIWSTKAEGRISARDMRQIDFAALVRNSYVKNALMQFVGTGENLMDLTFEVSTETTKDNVKTTVYRIPHDPVKRKIITVREGSVPAGNPENLERDLIEIVVGLEFDERTGEVKRSVKLDDMIVEYGTVSGQPRVEYQIETFLRTLTTAQARSLGLKTKADDLFTLVMQRVYHETAKKRFGLQDTHLWHDLAKMGISRATTFDIVEETPVILEGGYVAREQIENAGLNWNEISGKLIRKGWA